MSLHCHSTPPESSPNHKVNNSSPFGNKRILHHVTDIYCQRKQRRFGIASVVAGDWHFNASWHAFNSITRLTYARCVLGVILLTRDYDSDLLGLWRTVWEGHHSKTESKVNSAIITLNSWRMSYLLSRVSLAHLIAQMNDASCMCRFCVWRFTWLNLSTPFNTTPDGYNTSSRDRHWLPKIIT